METARHIQSIRRPSYDVADRPFILFWEVTRACDLACKHCRAEAAPICHPEELTNAEGHALIDQVAAFGQPSPLMVMTGGDPMKRPDLPELVSYAVSQHLAVALSPSATPLLTPEALAMLKNAGLKVISLSLDGASAATHDTFRGVEGVFDRTLKLWQAALTLGLKVQINTTVSRTNLTDLPQIAHLVRLYGALTWSVFFLVPTGRGSVLEPITADECEDVMHFLYDVGTAIPVKTTEGHHFKRVVAERTILEQRGLNAADVLHHGPTYYALRKALEPWPEGEKRRRSPMDVNVGRGVVFISHVGKVYPGGFLPLVAGDFREASLQTIYRTSPLFLTLRETSSYSGRCGRCEFAPICGGSRSRAYGATGDPLAEDPLCAYQPGSFPFPEDVRQLIANESSAPVMAAH
jgi:radical SAM protein